MLNIDFTDVSENESRSDALILPFCEGTGTAPYKETDAALRGAISRCIKTGEFEGRENQITMLHTMGMIKPSHLILAGLGKEEGVTAEKLRRAGGRLISGINPQGVKNASLSIRHLLSRKLSPALFVEGALLAAYKFSRYKKKESGIILKKISIIGKPDNALRKEIKWSLAVISGVNFARDMINAPSNEMTPSAMAKIARKLGKGRVSVKVLGRKDAGREGMGAYLSVASGSNEQPKFIVLRYNNSRRPPIVLIGKSITFDSGGISIKPSEGMEKMKYDMAGGAAVLAVIKIAAETGLPVNLVGILPATENLPGGSASKPGDIVRTIAGKTVEIVNTDAEGRLTLADAIGYSKRYKPGAIIDIATLTGACSVALGNEAIAMMGNSDGLMKKLSLIGDELYERVWQMPLYEEYGDYIKSDFADIKNSGGKTGSLVTAASFLKEFAGDTPWVHLDIAGTAWADKDKPYMPKGATGTGVRLLSNFLKET